MGVGWGGKGVVNAGAYMYIIHTYVRAEVYYLNVASLEAKHPKLAEPECIPLRVQVPNNLGFG